METDCDVSSGSGQTVYPADMISGEYDSGFGNWGNFGNGPTDPARVGKDIVDSLD